MKFTAAATLLLASTVIASPVPVSQTSDAVIKPKLTNSERFANFLSDMLELPGKAKEDRGADKYLDFVVEEMEDNVEFWQADYETLLYDHADAIGDLPREGYSQSRTPNVTPSEGYALARVEFYEMPRKSIADMLSGVWEAMGDRRVYAFIMLLVAAINLTTLVGLLVLCRERETRCDHEACSFTAVIDKDEKRIAL